MVEMVGAPRYPDDERTLALLRRLAAGDLSPATVASELFAAAPESEGPITADALHIAAEATTDNDLDLAGQLWLELLYRASPSAITSSTATLIVEHWTVAGRPETITAAMTVPAAAP